MSKMLRLELVGLVLLACTQILTENRDSFSSSNQYGHRSYSEWRKEPATREVNLKYGRLRGLVVQPTTNSLQPVDVFLGIPYAEPPIHSSRFSPPKSPPPWSGVREFVEFSAVCPQVLPNIEEELEPARRKYLEKLMPFLENQSEDCLYLNIYAPHQEPGRKMLRKFPVIVFIHGESFDWNSGNPYDGSVIASYGSIVFVTINFRLGILGFLRPGTKDDTPSNFGLLDQTAALLWLRENIAKFGGDPESITLLGHGTGAIFANLLLLSPLSEVSDGKGHKVNLFQRAILMSGSALSPNAIGKAPLQITKQVAHALNCQGSIDGDLARCLRDREVDDLLNVKIEKPKYVPAFAPLIDSAVIPKKPLELMKEAERFSRFDLLYGVTEYENFHILPGVALLDGLTDSKRDEFLQDSVKATHEMEPQRILSKALEHYRDDLSKRSRLTRKAKNRDIALEVISDSGTVAPLISMANLHSAANAKSFMYVFTHINVIPDGLNHQIRKTIHGQELPYVLGAPLDGGKYHLTAPYSIGEIQLSKYMMKWWCNFAYTGNPNVPRKPGKFLSDGYPTSRYDIDWPEYDPENQTYFNLTMPPQIGSRYRAADIEFWNEAIPVLLRYPNAELSGMKRQKARPYILNIADGVRHYGNGSRNAFSTEFGLPNRFDGKLPVGYLGKQSEIPEDASYEEEGKEVASTEREGEGVRSSSAISMVIGFGVVFLLINASALVYLYRKRQRMKKKVARISANQRDESFKRARRNDTADRREFGYCNSASKPDLNELIKNDKAYDNNSNFGRRSKLSRENSSSTIDTRIKVRDWIHQEIVHRCSPRFLRKTRETLQREHRAKLMKQQNQELQQIDIDDGHLDTDEKETKFGEEEFPYDECGPPTVHPETLPSSKVSIGIDATPSARTQSILDQIPIEYTRRAANNSEREHSDYYDLSSYQQEVTPQIVMVEHHHSTSDPLPLESHYGTKKVMSSTAKINESDSGSSYSLYAKINPKMKSRLPAGHTPPAGDRGATLPRLLTFAAPVPPTAPDVSVTCREIPLEPQIMECSHEEALKTIKRRNYPKVLPDIQKRRSLPPPSSLAVGKQLGTNPPSPPPRNFGTSKSLEFVEDLEEDVDLNIKTDLHIGPLRKKNDSVKNQSNSSIPELDDFHQGVTSFSEEFMDISEQSRSNRAMNVTDEVDTVDSPCVRESLPHCSKQPRIVITPRIEACSTFGYRPSAIPNFQFSDITRQSIENEEENRASDNVLNSKVPKLLPKPSTIPKKRIVHPDNHRNLPAMGRNMISGNPSSSLDYSPLSEMKPRDRSKTVSRIPSFAVRRDHSDIPDTKGRDTPPFSLQLERVEFEQRVDVVVPLTIATSSSMPDESPYLKSQSEFGIP